MSTRNSRMEDGEKHDRNEGTMSKNPPNTFEERVEQLLFSHLHARIGFFSTQKPLVVNPHLERELLAHPHARRE
jgi:hypothetical protein